MASSSWRWPTLLAAWLLLELAESLNGNDQPLLHQLQKEAAYVSIHAFEEQLEGPRTSTTPSAPSRFGRDSDGTRWPASTTPVRAALGTLGPASTTPVRGALGTLGPASTTPIQAALGNLGPASTTPIRAALGNLGPASTTPIRGALGNLGPASTTPIRGALGNLGPASTTPIRGALGNLGPASTTPIRGALGNLGPASTTASMMWPHLNTTGLATRSHTTHPPSATTTSTTVTPTKYYRQPLANYDDVQYWGNLEVGGQLVQGVMDTGSYELLVASKDCQGCGDAAVYENSNTTTELGYTTFHFYGSGTTYSAMVADTVKIPDAPDDKGLHATDQYFWEILKAAMPVLTSGNFQAIVGLGPPEIPDDDAQADAELAEQMQSTWGDKVDNLDAEAHDSSARATALAAKPTMLENWDVHVFSICLQRPNKAQGYLMWNDQDTMSSQPAVFSYIKVTGQRTWGVKMQDVALGDAHTGCEGGCGAIVDSGTSIILTDPTTWVNLNAFLVEQQRAGVLEKDCSNLDVLPDLTFTLDGSIFALPPQSYVGMVNGSVPDGYDDFFPNAESGEGAVCNVLVAPMYSYTDDGPLWVLGMPFLREYYTSFDLGQNPRDPASRRIYTAPAGENCYPASADEAKTSTMVQRQRKEIRYVDRSKVMIPAWALTASQTGFFMM